MDTSSPEYTIVHRALDPQPEYNIVLLQKGNEYCVLYEYVVNKQQYLPIRLWNDIGYLAQRGISLLADSELDASIEMGEFIREYVGEARWILAVLANT